VKKLLFVVVLLLLSAAPSFAQGVSIGIKGGANAATIAFKGEPDASARRWLPAIGAFAVLPVRWGLEFQPEVLYTMKGTRLRGSGAPSSVLLDYLEVPLLARVTMHAGGRRIYAVGGPTAAFRLRARTRTEFSGSTEETDISDEVRRVDAGVAAGAGVEFGSLAVEGRYTFGLSNIDTDAASGARARTRTVSLTAGCRFR
jgi:hypothetical protein